MIVYKFGGALAKSRRGLEALVRLTHDAYHAESISQRRRQRAATVGRAGGRAKSAGASVGAHAGENGVVLVVSAIGHTTRHLARAAELAEQGMLQPAEEALDRIIVQHKQLARTLRLDRENDLANKIDTIASDVRGLLEGIAITLELSPRTRDAVIANGEHLAGSLVYALLHDRKLPVRLIDARTVIITDDEFGHAAPLVDEIEERAQRFIASRLKRSEIVLIQGFIGATLDGIPTTMGSESSDLTATLLAGSLGAQEVVIWKVVPGIFSADPEIVPNAKLLRSLSFEEAEEIGRRGARILYPTFAHPLLREHNRTVLRIATPFAQAARHTTLSRQVSERPSPNTTRAQKAIAVALTQRLAVVKLVMRNTSEEVAQLLSGSPLKGAGRRRKQERMRTAMHSALALWSTSSETMLLLPKDDIAAILKEIDLDTFAIIEQPSVSARPTVAARATLAALAVIIRKPNNDTADPRFIQQIARSLRAFPVHAIIPIEQSIIAIVDDAEAIQATKKLHHDLFEKRSRIL